MRAGQTAGVVALAVGGFLAVASLIGPSDSVDAEHPGTAQPIVRSSVVCPYVDGEADHETQVGVLALPDVETATDEGEPQPITVTALRLPPAVEPDEPEDAEETEEAEETPAPAEPEAEPAFTVDQRGVPVVNGLNTDQGTSFAIEGQGSMAAGLAGEQSSLLQRSDLRGLSSTPCTVPAREHWFVGGSGEVGRRGRLILSNPTDVPAVVDLELWDESGPLDAPATKDIGVPARTQQLLLLDALAPDSVSVGVHVQATQGRVAAALEVRESDGEDGQGMSYVPEAAEPAERIAIPGVPGHGERVLRILAPGDVDAIVSLRALGAEGAFTPAGLEATTVTAGSMVDVPLDALGDAAGGLLLESDQPITAAVRVVERPGEGDPDMAFTSAATPLASPAAALLGRTDGGVASWLYLSSVVDTAVRVTVRTLAADGSVAAEDILDLPPLATITLPLNKPEGMAVSSVVVEPSAADSVIVSREMTGSDDDGALIDLMTLVSPPVTVEVPDVVGELPEVPAPGETADLP